MATTAIAAPLHGDAKPRTEATEPPESMQMRIQRQRIESKFNQVQMERRAAHVLRMEFEQKKTNQKTDEQIMLLMQADERLAALLSQAAESMCALLPPGLDSASEAAASSSSNAPTYGAKAFEVRAQTWFTILNEVQYTLRTAMRHLREAQLAPLTAPVGPEARASGLAGSAAQGHSLSLMSAFVDMSGNDGAAFKLPPLPSSSPRRSALSSLDKSQSIHALREKNRNWKDLSRSLQNVEKNLQIGSLDKTAPKHESLSKQQSSPLTADSLQQEDAAVVDAIQAGSRTDKFLLQALLNANGLA